MSEQETDVRTWPEVSGMRYLPMLDQMHDILKPDWYLEVGTFRGRSLSLCRGNFVAVDPEFKLKAPMIPPSGRQMHFFQLTSDDFFASDFLQRNALTFQFAFLDGLHHYDALLRDFIGAEKVMTKDGVIALHDCCPTPVEMTSREMNGDLWTGDVWKTIKVLKTFRPDLEIDVTTARPTGLAIVRNLDPESRVLEEKYDRIIAEFDQIKLDASSLDEYYASFEVCTPRHVLTTL
ncbi:MAG: class I SAM-dependent methyltransferase [Boseongicola sp.]|nr:class I SAM-dependent methyltransferase [Boseongicola sp.]MDD9976364.1 class I SAM-dependent methyltransferase [Boseongicola sp.]